MECRRFEKEHVEAAKEHYLNMALEWDASDYNRWIAKVEEGDRRTFVAIKDEEIVAYIDIAEEGEDLLSMNGFMWGLKKPMRQEMLQSSLRTKCDW